MGWGEVRYVLSSADVDDLKDKHENVSAGCGNPISVSCTANMVKNRNCAGSMEAARGSQSKDGAGVSTLELIA